VTRRIVFRPQLEVEVAEAASWYEAQRQGLGKDFLHAVDRTVSALAEHPLRFRKVHRESRRAPVDRFPYGIIFQVTEEEIVLVACMHSRRHPGHWQGRR
jgi:toxin ParE1/3/4